MRFIRLRFRMQTLLILVALAAIAMWPATQRLRPPPKLTVQGMRPSPFDHMGGERSPSFFARMKRLELPARDPNLLYYPLVHIHGQEALSYSQQDLSALRTHLNPGGGTLFVDGDSRNPAFDKDFRRFVAELFPKQSLTAIPWDDALYSKGICNDLTNVQYNRAAGGGRGQLRLEGVKIDGHWAIIYSKDDISCSMEKDPPNDPPGYTRDSSSKILENIIIHSIEP
jgi:hypothetical protein